jgi:cobalt-zinc-cadmium efflux system outer membrane protein
MHKSHARSRLAVGAILSISSLSLFTGSAAADPITLQQALDRADQRPTVAMAIASSEAARHHAEQAGLATYNPELSVAAGPRFVDGDRNLAVQLGLAQTFELGGKRQARRAVAEARIEAAAAEQTTARTQARLETWRAFQLALIARERVVSAHEAEQVAVQIEAATVERQKVGFGTQLELNLTNAEVGRARHERLDAERKHEEALALLASTVGGPPRRCSRAAPRACWPRRCASAPRR